MSAEPDLWLSDNCLWGVQGALQAVPLGGDCAVDSPQARNATSTARDADEAGKCAGPSCVA